MGALRALTMSAVSFCLVGVVYAEGRSDRDRDNDRDDANVVTDVRPACTASMTLKQDANGCSSWTVRGQVRKPYRGPGAAVKLHCQTFSSLAGGGGTSLVFPSASACDAPPCPGDVNARGNFSFDIPICEGSPQLPAGYVCVFVVHGDGQTDPNGSAPCSGEFCPNSP